MKPTALDAPADVLDPDETRFVEVVREHGWFHTVVSEDAEGPGFSYTTGLQISLGHPEIVVFGWKQEVASAILWDIYRAIAVGDPPPIDIPAGSFANFPLTFLPVASEYHREYLGWSRWFYGSDHFDCLQLVWTDRKGLFPWQAAFDSQGFGTVQPDLTAGGWAGRFAT